MKWNWNFSTSVNEPELALSKHRRGGENPLGITRARGTRSDGTHAGGWGLLRRVWSSNWSPATNSAESAQPLYVDTQILI